MCSTVFKNADMDKCSLLFFNFLPVHYVYRWLIVHAVILNKQLDTVQFIHKDGKMSFKCSIRNTKQIALRLNCITITQSADGKVYTDKL